MDPVCLPVPHIRALSKVPVRMPDESLWSFVVRTARLHGYTNVRFFLQDVLGYTGKHAMDPNSPRAYFDFRFPRPELVRLFAAATLPASGESSLDDLERSYREGTLIPLANALELEHAYAGIFPFVASESAVCPRCFSEGDLPYYRPVAWQYGLVTLCLRHDKPVLLVEHCPKGSPVDGSFLGTTLPFSPAHHKPSHECKGCFLGDASAAVVVPFEDVKDRKGLVAQQIIQAKLLGWKGPYLKEVITALAEPEGTIGKYTTAEFLEVLRAYYIIAKQVANDAPRHIHKPLTREHDEWPRIPATISSYRKARTPMYKIDRYKMHCLIATAIDWMLNGPDVLYEPMEALIVRCFTLFGLRDLQWALSFRSLKGVTYMEIQETVVEVYYRLLEGRVTREEIASVRSNSPILFSDGETSAWANFQTEQARQRHQLNYELQSRRLSTSELGGEEAPGPRPRCTYTTGSCQNLATRGQGDYRYCLLHEHRCMVEHCRNLGLVNGLCRRHGGYGPEPDGESICHVVYEQAADAERARHTKDSQHEGTREKVMDVIQLLPQARSILARVLPFTDSGDERDHER